MMLFIVKRLASAVLTLATIAVLVFYLQMHFLWQVLHVSPAAALVYPHDTPANIARMNAALGLTQPLPVQFLDWVRATFVDGGMTGFIRHQLPPTVELLALGALWAAVLSVLIAMLQVKYAGRWLDHILDGLMVFISVIPGFWLGLLLLIVFAVYNTWFPGSGYPLPGAGLLSWIYHLTLPSVALALTTLAPWTRTLRGSLVEASHADYVRTARAKGVPERRVRSRHMLRNSIMPLVTLIGLSLPVLLNTVVVLERIYVIPGAGAAFFGALDTLFYAQAASIALVLAMVTVVGSMAADLAYGLIDPRINYR